MALYEFVRAKLPGGQWDIPNLERVDGEGAQIHLSKEVEAALPGVAFKVLGDEAVLCVMTENTLVAADVVTLADVVADHKANA